MKHSPYTLPNGITLLESPVWVGPVNSKWTPMQDSMFSTKKSYCMRIGTRGGEIVLWDDVYHLLYDIRDDLIAHPE